MATDFTNNNTTIGTTGAFKPSTRNTPLDIRTRVNLKADIESIPNPFVGMHIIVLQDETNDNQMTEYVVTSLKANNLGVADSKINEVVLAKDFLGVSGSTSGSGITSEQVQQLNAAYTHSQSAHVQQSDIPTKIGQLENDSNFISSIPEEYVTEQELNAKGLATEAFVTNKIAEASIGGGEGSTVDLSGLGADLSLNGQTLKLKNSNGVEIGTGVTLPQASTIDAYTKTETDAIIQDYTGGKKQVYLTQAEYDLLTDLEKNDVTKVYNITDATEQIIPTDLTIDSNNLLQLKDSNGNAIGTGVTVSTTSEGTQYTLPTASSTTLGGIKVGDRLSIDSNGVLSADIQESTPSNELILTSPSGYRFKVIVNDEGVLSTEEILTLGNIIASVSELSINEGESATFTISLSETPTRAQTISIVSDNTDVTVNPSSIAISDTNPHIITVSAAEDEGDYADETAVLTLSSPKVSNVTINVAIKDNDIEPKPCTGISLDQTSLSLNTGMSKQLIATVTPEGCTDEIVWSASNENCTVVNGLVTAITEGDCIITATCGEQSATCTITVSIADIITDGILMYFDSTLIDVDVHTAINNTSINDAIVPDQTLRFRNFKDDGTDGITDEYKGIFFNGVGMIEPMMNNETTVFGGNEETSIRTVEIFGKYDASINPSNKGIGGIAHQHSPINYSRQIIKRIKDGYEMASGATTVRQLNFPGYQVAMNDGYFHVAYTDATSKNSDNNNLCDWLSFAFGASANNGSLLNTTIYAVRIYNRVLSSEELNHNMAIDLAKVNYTQNIQENSDENENTVE